MQNNTETPSLVAPKPSEDGLVAPKPSEGATLVQTSDSPIARQDLENLLNAKPSLSVQPVTSTPPATVIHAAPAALQNKSRRRGRVARLPKLQRDMVNHMLYNGVPYKNIVVALAGAGFDVMERNISNWATGGYLEWRLHQDLVLENRLNQDHLLDHLRREDAPELSEVGLQAAATHLSQTLLLKAARGENVGENLAEFSQMVDLLSRLNRELALLQKQRDDSRRTLGPAHDAARIKNEEQNSAAELEREYSDPDPDSGLDQPVDPPLVPPRPTSQKLETKDSIKHWKEKKEHAENILAMVKAINGKASAAAAPAASNENPQTSSAS